MLRSAKRPLSDFASASLDGTLLAGTEKARPKAALDKYNAENQGANFEFVELVRTNARVCNGLMHYITFEAKDDEEDATTHTFQAKVLDRPRNMGAEVKMCQMKPNLRTWCHGGNIAEPSSL